MKAPDKIHITEGKNNCGILTGYWHSIRGAKIKTEEYIRKDVILEYLNGLDTNSNYERFVIDNLIGHIESL